MLCSGHQCLQHRLKLALEKAKRANLPPKELGLIESLINSICDTFNEMAAWDIEMAKIYSEKSYVSSSKYNSQLETIAKQMEARSTKTKVLFRNGGRFQIRHSSWSEITGQVTCRLRAER